MLTRRHFLRTASGLLAAAAAPATWAATVSKEARTLHDRMMIFDAHVHALDREFYHGGSMGELSDQGQWDLVRARQGGEDAFFLSVYVPEEYYPGRFETKQALRRIDHALRQIESCKSEVDLACNASEVRRAIERGRLAAVLDIEGSYDLDGDLGVLRELHAMGLRSAQLSAHNWNQAYADSCCSASRAHGLTADGKKLIHEMNRLRMVINVSHSADATMEQAIESSDVPVVATHHGLRSVNDIPRNISDALMQKLAAKGGVLGLQIGSEFSYPKEYAWITEHRQKTFWDTKDIPERVRGKTIQEIDEIVAPAFPMLGAQVPESVQMQIENWVDAVDRAIQVIGEDHVALGSDFDGGPTLAHGMRDVALVTEAMLRRGYSEKRIEKFWGGNLLRVFGEITGG